MDEAPESFHIDRAVQRELLLHLRASYPNRVLDRRGLAALIAGQFPAHAREEGSDAFLNGQLLYLEELGLCEAGVTVTGQNHWSWYGPKITAKGLDFLEDDGGLSAILNVVTVRLHADTLRDLLTAKIDAAELPEVEKATLKEHVRKLPATMLQAATTDLVKVGLENVPNMLHWLRALTGLG